LPNKAFFEKGKRKEKRTVFKGHHQNTGRTEKTAKKGRWDPRMRDLGVLSGREIGLHGGTKRKRMSDIQRKKREFLRRHWTGLELVKGDKNLKIKK